MVTDDVNFKHCSEQSFTKDLADKLKFKSSYHMLYICVANTIKWGWGGG